MGIKVRFLDGERLRNAFVAGTMALERRREHLNRINVFPVPDGDTGDNMVSTCRSIAERSVASKSISVTVSSMAEAAFDGARGNSGIIFCQYIHGFARALERHTAADAKVFARGLHAAVPFAEEALHKPVEGTILTVMRDWSREVLNLSETVDDFAVLLPASLEAAKRSLRDTPRRLDLLARRNVVDAGAQGFVDFLEGIVDFIEKGDLRRVLVQRPPLPSEEPSEHLHEGLPPYRYCTEVVLQGEGLSGHSLGEELSAYGDSVVVGGGDTKYRVHLHTNAPAELFERLSTRGSLGAQKVDDMRRQVEAGTRRISPIALVTDSCCDLPQELLDRHQIHMLPLKLSCGGSDYLDKITISPERVYKILRETKSRISTAQPGFGDLVKRYSFLNTHYESIISIHLSAALSGAWSASRKAAESVNGEKIRVIDSKTICAAQGLLVLKAAEAIAEGRSAEEIVRIIERTIPRTRLFASLHTLKYLVRGGRVSPMKGFVASLLNLVPIISVDSEGKAFHSAKPASEAANRKKILETFESLVERSGLWKYAVVHADAPDKAEELASDLARICGADPEYLMEISPVIGINAGPDSVGFAMILND